MSPFPAGWGDLAVEDLPGPVWEVSGPDHVLVAANRAARRLLGEPVPGRPLREGPPTLATAAVLAQLDAVRTTASGARAVYAVDTGRPGGRVLVELDAVPVQRHTGDGVLVHAREIGDAVDDEANDHGVTLAIQGALVPAALPVLPDVVLAGRYLPAAIAARAGGDWFDALVTGAGRLAVVSGDVVGHGSAAVVAMAELRAVLRAALLDGDDLGAALQRLDRHAARSPATRAATVAVALLDPASGALDHAGCGHLPPLVRAADGRARLLPGSGDGPLGTGATAPLRVQRTRLEPGETLVLFGDGLVQRARHSLDDGLARLLAEAGRAAQGPDALCDGLLGALPGAGHDDVTVLAVRRRGGPVAGITMDVPADPGQLSGVRERLTDWLTALDVSADGLTAVPLVVSELVSNAIEHAYAGAAAGRVRIGVDLDGTGGARAVVADDGRWRHRDPATDRSRGFGLTVARELTTGLDIATGPDGTRVTAVCPLGNRTVVAASGGPRLTAVPDTLTIARRDGSPPRIAVTGPVDMGTVDELRTTVLHASAGGTREVVLDLTAVTLLASAGVRLLHEIARFPGPPRIVAPPGSPSRQVLELTRLEHLLAETA